MSGILQEPEVTAQNTTPKPIEPRENPANIATTARAAQPATRSTIAKPQPNGAETIAAERERERAGGLVMAARIALRRGQMDVARAKLQEAFAITPTDCGALELLGDIFMEEGEQEKAIRVFERGLQFHPKHAPFEEKIAVAHLDLDEMRRDQMRRDALLEGGEMTAEERIFERKPGRAMGVSLLVPGAGQYYNGEEERAFIFGGVAVGLLLLWSVPFLLSLGQLPEPLQSFNNVMRGWPAIGRLAFYATVLAWLASHVYAAVDAFQGATRANDARRYGVGLEV